MPEARLSVFRIGLAGLVLALLLLSGCSKAPVTQQQSYVFGTLVEVTIAGVPPERAQQLTAQVFAEFDRLHHEFHAWQPGPLQQLNAALAAGQSYAADPQMLAVLRDARGWADRSGNLFNPAIGGLIGLWGFHADEFVPHVPGSDQIAAWVQAQPKLDDLQFNGNQISSRNRAVQVDLGGYAKGYALDRAAALLRAAGVKNALINIGGNVLALGTRNGEPWRVGIRHPRENAPMAVLALHDGEAIGTSGDYQRYFEVNGQRYCHLIDPATGWPARGVWAATVLAEPGPQAGVLSDVASKPVFIGGVAKFPQSARAMGVAALMVDDKGGVQVTEALYRRLEWVTRPKTIKVWP